MPNEDEMERTLRIEIPPCALAKGRIRLDTWYGSTEWLVNTR